MPYAVIVVMTVDRADPDEAAAFVRAELLSKRGVGDQPWQTERPDLLPRWQIASVRREVRRNEHGGPAE